MKNRKAIGIDIGGTNFRIGLVSEDGKLENFSKTPVTEIIGKGNPLSDLEQHLKSYIEGLSDSDQKVSAVCIGLPAALDKDRKHVLQSPNLKFDTSVAVDDYLSDSLGGVPVFLANDVDIALFYDIREHQIPTDGKIITGFYFGTGLGNSIMINSSFIHGCHGVAAELGHIPVDGNDIICGCGNTGCIETVAAGKYLAALCKNEYKCTDISDLFALHADEELLVQFVDRMAMAVATEVTILDPDYILLGGGVLAMKAFPKRLLVERIVCHTRKPYPAEDMNIIFTEDLPEKCVIGSAQYAFSRI